VDAEIDTTGAIVAPADRAGVTVDFGVKVATQSAIVVFTKPDRSFVPVGAHGQIEGGTSFVIGYDGQAYIKDLAKQNAATIEFGESRCRATFAYTHQPDTQVVISPVVCQYEVGIAAVGMPGQPT